MHSQYNKNMIIKNEHTHTQSREVEVMGRMDCLEETDMEITLTLFFEADSIMRKLEYGRVGDTVFIAFLKMVVLRLVLGFELRASRLSDRHAAT
jgi:hypothetical protein